MRPEREEWERRGFAHWCMASAMPFAAAVQHFWGWIAVAAAVVASLVVSVYCIYRYASDRSNTLSVRSHGDPE